MQNRLLPLVCLMISSQAYSEDTATSRSMEGSTVTNNSVNVLKDEPQTSPSSSESSQQTDSIVSDTAPELTFEPKKDEPVNSSDANSHPQEASPKKSEDSSEKAEAVSISDGDDGIDEDLIAELLEEDEGDDDKDDAKELIEDTQRPEEAAKNPPPKKAQAKKSTSSSKWLPEIEFGYRSEQGNEDERSLNARAALSHISGRLRNSGEIKIYLKNEDGEEDEREQTYQLQSDYKISPKFYIYGNFKGIDSKYTSYFHDYTVSTGLGYQFYNTETLKLETELGPGYRYQEPNTDEIDDDDPIFPENVDEPIIRANITAYWKPLDNISLNFDGTLVGGSSNTRFDSEISIVNDITDDIALKLSQSIEHLSRVPNNLEKTDTVFTINILYAPK